MKIFEDSIIYGVSDTGFDHTEYLKELLISGIDVIQLRDKDLSDREFYNVAVALKKTAADFRKPFIINDRLDIALLVDADGVHIGDEDLPPREVRSILGRDKVLGYSCHSYQDALDVKDLDLDYISVGPIFKSNTKKNLETIGENEIELIVENIKFSQVAIGGINLENISKVRGYGFSNVAVVSSLKTARDKKRYVNEIRKVITDDTYR
ncbi:MAG: thiamine phosphate synthase [Candidatus Kaelpia aquatica]|nr:thiamine phosphate synthase [Candidatus Kaelpia aquatica]